MLKLLFRTIKHIKLKPNFLKPVTYTTYILWMAIRRIFLVGFEFLQKSAKKMINTVIQNVTISHGKIKNV